jgi:hypothetical protein
MRQQWLTHLQERLSPRRPIPIERSEMFLGETLVIDGDMTGHAAVGSVSPHEVKVELDVGQHDLFDFRPAAGAFGRKEIEKRQIQERTVQFAGQLALLPERLIAFGLETMQFAPGVGDFPVQVFLLALDGRPLVTELIELQLGLIESVLKTVQRFPCSVGGRIVGACRHSELLVASPGNTQFGPELFEGQLGPGVVPANRLRPRM